MNGAIRAEGPSKWGVALLLAIVAITVRVLTHPSSTTTPEPITAQPAAMATTDASPLPETPPEVSRTDVDRAARHAGLALGADGAAGAMIYSVNCYASLERAFAVVTLDRCGAFDLLASRQAIDALEQAETAAWFDASAARRRYLEAASAGGISTEEATARLARVGELSNGETVEPVTPPPAVVADESSEPDGTEPTTTGEKAAEVQDNVGNEDAEPDGE